MQFRTKPSLLASLRAMVATALTLSFASLGADRPEYSIVELAPPGMDFVQPARINDLGDVVGSGYDVVNDVHPFLYRQGVFQQLGDPEDIGYAIDLNNAGQILCYFQRREGFFPVLITPEGNLVNLNVALAGHFGAFAINDQGDILMRNEDTYQGFVYNHRTGARRSLEDPGTLNFRDINNAGDVVGLFANDDGEFGTLFSGNSYIHFQLQGKRQLTDATLINNRGQVAGFAYELNTFSVRPYIYEDGHFTHLGTLAGDDSAGPDGMNDSGDLVGASWGASTMRAFLYRDHHMKDLNGLIPAGSGWTLTEAISINNQGKIVGQGFRDGNQKGFLLAPLQRKKTKDGFGEAN